MRALSFCFCLLALLGVASAAARTVVVDGETVAIQAGTAHLVEDGRVVTGGATLLLRDGRILAAGASEEIDVPPDALVVDYGPDAVLVPGLVAASGPGSPAASQRTAAPDLLAIDNFDPFSRLWTEDLSAGVTTLYLAPARTRLIAGQGAVVKLAGSDPERRVLSASATIHGSISANARRTPGYWEPPIPATVDVGLGVYEPQLPRSTMGAIVALGELLAAAREDRGSEAYGDAAPRELRMLMERGVPWRVRAVSHAEISAILRFAEENDLPLVVDGARDVADLADELAAAGAQVVFEVDYSANGAVRELGKGREARWPVYDAPAALAEAGVPFAISTNSETRARDLRFAASLASRGGLSEEAALRAITLGPAEILGVDAHVGSLSAGKDADVVVLNGPPLTIGTSVMATWVDGEKAWGPTGHGEHAVVLEVAELHVGDGEVLRPGQVLLRDGRIDEVGTRVAHPPGAVVVRGAAAMPGMIDALGHLGLEGSGQAVPATYPLARIIEPGDFTDRRVARAGVTTVCLSTRSAQGGGSPVMAYKPAAEELDHMVVGDPVALRLKWTDRNRLKSGAGVRDLLQKGLEYDASWREYEEAMASWVPPPPEPVEGEEEDDDEKEGESSEEKKDEDDDEDSKKKSKKKKKKKKGDEPDRDLLSGIWEGHVGPADGDDDEEEEDDDEEGDDDEEEGERIRLRLEVVGDWKTSERVIGSLRCDPVSGFLVALEGSYVDGELDVSGIGSRGRVRVRGSVELDDDDDEEEIELEGTLTVAGEELELEAERVSAELPFASRAERRREKVEKAKAPKGMPKEPKKDDKLELLRRAIQGDLAVLVDVDREDEILACIEAFEPTGIRPVLHGADDAWRVAGEIADHVDGVLLTHRVLVTDPEEGLSGRRHRFDELARAGIPVAFQSQAEEGAAELPLMAAFAVSQGMSPTDALRALSAGVAEMMHVEDRIGRLQAGLDGDVLLLDGPPLDPSTRVLRTWVAGREVQ